MLTYRQTTGSISLIDDTWGYGYSGQPPYKNDPAAQDKPDLGPLPCGLWHIVGVHYRHESLGPYVMNLEPEPQTTTFGRSSFRIHGDSISKPGYASHGCLVFSRPLRTRIWESGDRDIWVKA